MKMGKFGDKAKANKLNIAIGTWIVLTMIWIFLFYTAYVAGWGETTKAAFSWLAIIFSTVLLVGNAKFWFFSKFTMIDKNSDDYIPPPPTDPTDPNSW